jgi:DNA-binding XRE family transcriptional regulator
MDPERNQGAKVPAGASDPAPTAEVSGGSAAPEPVGDRAGRGKRLRAGSKTGTHPNNDKRLRQGAMMSKAELARRAGVSPLTIDRVEAGCPCRMDTKRKILEALGLQPAAAKDVFPEIELG